MNHKDLRVWQKSYELCLMVYKLTESMPTNEKYGLISQIQRSAVSIPSNIAEGQQRGTNKEFKHFLQIAKASSAELETQLLLTRDIYDTDVTVEINIIDEIQRMLQTLISKME